MDNPASKAKPTSQPQVPKVFPDMDSCRVQLSGCGEYLDCFGFWAWLCPFGLKLGNAVVCRHPEGKRILAGKAKGPKAHVSSQEGSAGSL